MLTGAVVGFNLFPVAFDSQGRATDYQVQITAAGLAQDAPEEKVLWENPAFTFRDNYQFNATAATYVDRENDAIDRVAGPVRAEPRDEHAGGVLAVAARFASGLRLRRTGLRLAGRALDRRPDPSLRASLPRREPPPSLRSGDYSRRELEGDGRVTKPPLHPEGGEGQG